MANSLESKGTTGKPRCDFLCIFYYPYIILGHKLHLTSSKRKSFWIREGYCDKILPP